MPVRILMVGYGAISEHHARILRADGAILETVVGRLPSETARFAAEHGFRHHGTDLDAALKAWDCDAAVVASPHAMHYEQTRLALLAGKHVLCEIPLSLSYAEGLALVALAKRQNRTLMVAHSYRFNPGLVAVRQRVGDGSLHIRHVIARSVVSRLTNVGWTGRQRSWTDDVLWHQGCHLVDCCLWLLGAQEVEVQGSRAEVDPRTGTSLDADVLLRTASGQLANISLSYNARTQTSEFLIIGEEDTFHYTGGVLRNSTEVLLQAEGLSRGSQIPAWEAQDREFLAALREGRAPSMSGADALGALSVLQQVQDRCAALRDAGT